MLHTIGLILDARSVPFNTVEFEIGFDLEHSLDFSVLTIIADDLTCVSLLLFRSGLLHYRLSREVRAISSG